MEIKKILAPTDLSALSAKGVEYAAELAAKLGAELIIWHAVRTEEFVSHARLLENSPSPARVEQQLVHLVDRHKEMLHKFAQTHATSASGANVKEVVEMSEPQRSMGDFAKKSGIDLIVMSTHGRSGIGRIVMGSVTEKVLRHSPCPVLAVPVHER
ncbi:MAG: universal stress protein [Deltaproteobacteria bacterium]|nr:universal stress protein [Deltaproteobacteria bacterium]